MPAHRVYSYASSEDVASGAVFRAVPAGCGCGRRRNGQALRQPL